MDSINQKANELRALLDAELPPVYEVLMAKERLIEALMWANKAISNPETHQ